jgi:hypothetical protein
MTKKSLGNRAGLDGSGRQREALRKPRSRPSKRSILPKKVARTWPPPIQNGQMAVTATRPRSALRPKNGLSLGLSLPVLGFAVTIYIGRFDTALYDWYNGAEWFLEAAGGLFLLSIATCLWTWRESRWARLTPLILLLSWLLVFFSGAWVI